MVKKLALIILASSGLALSDYIDFTDRDAYRNIVRNQQTAQTTVQVDGQSVDMTLSTPVGTMTWNRDDGIGISYNYEYDEIEANEVLRVEFSQDVLLSDIALTDLFNENGYLEQGSYSLSDGSQGGFSADASQITSGTNGQKVVDINKVVSWIELSAPGYVNGQNHEFSLAGLTVFSAVPEISSLVLLGVFFAMLAAYHLKNRKIFIISSNE